MAIVIDGTGSITGLSAGGLPDGSITAADLASGAITAAALPAGSVLKVVSSFIGPTSTSSTSYTSTGLTASITPSSASNKILVIVDGMGSSSSTSQTLLRMVRNYPSANTVVDGQVQSPYSGNAYGYTMAICEGDRIRQPISSNMLDSPNTTSQIVYTLLFCSTGSTAYVGRWGTDANWYQQTTLTLMEIAA